MLFRRITRRFRLRSPVFGRYRRRNILFRAINSVRAGTSGLRAVRPLKSPNRRAPDRYAVTAYSGPASFCFRASSRCERAERGLVYPPSSLFRSLDSILRAGFETIDNH